MKTNEFIIHTIFKILKPPHFFGYCTILHNVLFFILGNSPAYEFYTPTFRNTLFHLHRQVGMKIEQSVLKRRHIKFRHR